ncbi:MAG: ATP-binding protein [Candidatus Omnitrophica bacterium]|nr:ATP-binding protein [Candidatus Omnitrophota bacterium]
MKKFTVKPKIFHDREVLISGQAQVPPNFVFLGRLAESGQITRINYDVSSEHVIAIFGKRGSGKSYTLGSFSEGLCTKEKETSISKISKIRGCLLFDTLGIFQWTDTPLSFQSTQEIIKQQISFHKGWDIKVEPLDVQVWIPRGTREDTTPSSYKDFTINTSDFNASDWGYLLGLDIFQDRMGQLLNDAYIKVTSDGWSDGRENFSPVKEYSVQDLISCIDQDTELQNNYQRETLRAVRQQLSIYSKNLLFQKKGTELTDLIRRGYLSILVMNKMSDELRSVIVSSIIRKVIESRIVASESEKRLRISSNLTEEEKNHLIEKITKSIPPSWIALDEAQNVLPSERKTSATDVLVKLVREGRNFGLSFMFTTQQPSAVDQRILAQVDTIIAHKLTLQNDIDYVRKNLKSKLPDEAKYGNSTHSFDELLRMLDIGQALVSDTETDRCFIVDIRPKVSVHGGF